MALVSSTLKEQLEKIIKESAESAYKSALTTKFKDGEDLKKLVEKQSKEFGEEFSKKASGKIANAIDAYIKTATIIVTATGPTGPVTGTATIS
jgi:ElaB/YqjD/DUF883 family membrane-anchored ribosome-binding protein